MEQSMKMHLYMTGQELPDPGPMYLFFIVCLSVYITVKIAYLLQSEETIKKERWDRGIVYVHAFKIIVIIISGWLAMEEIINPSFITTELKQCIVVVIGFEIVDEICELVTEIKSEWL